jgi:hypothetical protein
VCVPFFYLCIPELSLSFFYFAVFFSVCLFFLLFLSAFYSSFERAAVVVLALFVCVGVFYLGYKEKMGVMQALKKKKQKKIPPKTDATQMPRGTKGRGAREQKAATPSRL